MIRKKGSKYCLYSRKSGRNLGCSRTKAGARQREREVQYFKHRGGNRREVRVRRHTRRRDSRETERIVLDTARAYREEYGATPLDINAGMCETFSGDLVQRLGPGATAYWYDDEHIIGQRVRDINHCFVLYEGKFYDAEAPEGVDDYRNLPFFVRQRERGLSFPAFDPRFFGVAYP